MGLIILFNLHIILSEDSRSFGLINSNQVEGKAVFRFFPFNKIGAIK